jgi:hypothetical protein
MFWSKMVLAAEGVASRYLPDEERDIDGGGTGRHAGRVITEITAVGGDQSLVIVEAGMKIGEIAVVFGGRKPAGANPSVQTFH